MQVLEARKTSKTMPQGIRNAVLLYNPLAGGGGLRRLQELDEARQVFARSGTETELRQTRAPGDATALAREAVEQGREMLIVCGGDGTMNEVINGLSDLPAERQVPLALLPGGTANVLVKELGLPWDIPQAAELLSRGTARQIALGLATPLEKPEARRYFLSVAGAGPDGVMVYSLDPTLKLRTGILSYWYEGFRQLFRYTFPAFRVTAAGRTLDATMVIVGRTKHYGGPFQITTQADLREDSFELAVVTTRSRIRYLSFLPALWLGALRREPGVHFWKADAVVCEPVSREPVYAQVDGEPLGRLPVEFRIVRSALKLVFPPAFGEREKKNGAGLKAQEVPETRLLAGKR